MHVKMYKTPSSRMKSIAHPHRIYSTRETAAPLRRRSLWIQDHLVEKIPSWIQDLLTEKIGYLLYGPLFTLDLVSPFVFMDLAQV